MTATLELIITGATSEQLAAGIAAAEAVFAREQVTPLAGFEGRFVREGWDVRGFQDPQPTDAEMFAARVADEAEFAAIEAAIGGSERPVGCALGLKL
jgi:hypothetical protein